MMMVVVVIRKNIRMQMKRLMKKNMLMKMMLKKVPRGKMLLSDDDWDDDQDKDEDVGGDHQNDGTAGAGCMNRIRVETATFKGMAPLKAKNPFMIEKGHS